MAEAAHSKTIIVRGDNASVTDFVASWFVEVVVILGGRTVAMILIVIGFGVACPVHPPV